METRNFLNTKIISDATYDTAIAPAKYSFKRHYATWQNRFRVTQSNKELMLFSIVKHIVNLHFPVLVVNFHRRKSVSYSFLPALK